MKYSDVAVVVPWRITADRKQSFELAWEYNAQTFSEFKIYFSDSVGERFNVSEARNRGCIQAIEDGYKILVVIDADTVFEKQGIIDAIKLVRKTNLICYPYTLATETNEQISKWLSENSITFDGIEKYIKPSQYHVGSAWVMSADYFLEVNGWDERFLGWGWEDAAFQRAYEILYKERMPRTEGSCYRLWHSSRDVFDFDNNMNRYMQVYDAPKVGRKKLLKVLSGNITWRSGV